MRPLRGVAVAAVAAPWLLTRCGNQGTAGVTADASSDTTAEDARAFDATSVDRVAPDASVPMESAADDGNGNADSTVDAKFADGSASDAAVDAFMGIPCIPLGDGGGNQGASGDSGDAGDAGAAADGASEAGDAEQPGDAGADGDSGAIGSCPGTLSCCGGWCTDTSLDPNNCGSCGNACASNQFCTGRACDDAVVKNVCDNPRATVVSDHYLADDTTGGEIGTSLMNGCAPSVAVLTVAVDSGAAVDPTSGRPVTGPGDTLAAGGGYFGQPSVAYMEANALVPLVTGTDGTSSWIRSSKTSANVVLTPNTSLTSQHDYFVLEVGVEPASGTLCFFGYGMLAPGTLAAGYFFQNDVISNRSAFPDAWYVYEWTDTDNNGIPSAGDTFTLVGQGN